MFPRLFVKKQELVRQHKFLAADSASAELKRSLGQVLFVKTET